MATRDLFEHVDDVLVNTLTETMRKAILKVLEKGEDPEQVLKFVRERSTRDAIVYLAVEAFLERWKTARDEHLRERGLMS